MSNDLRVKTLIKELKLLDMAYTGRDNFWASKELQSLVSLHIADTARIRLSFAQGQRLSRIAIQGIVLKEHQKAKLEGKVELLVALDRILRGLGYVKKNKPKKLSTSAGPS